MRPKCAAFHPDGDLLVVGFSTGFIKFLSVHTLEDVGSASPSSDDIDCIKFSPSGQYIGGYDSGNHLFLFKR
jgi:WD40 repeat protein